MSSDKITFVVNGHSYAISASEPETLTAIAATDRKALITVLEAVKQQQKASEQRADQILMQTAVPISDNLATAIKPERLGRGDAEAVMARLILEEKAKQKNPPSERIFYKWIIGFAALVIMAILVF
tara:strand:- start:923 stop:1300 length:378 start_codon:yes stop_codon:yes gene_type:complete